MRWSSRKTLVEQRNIMALRFAFWEREGETWRFLDVGHVFFFVLLSGKKEHGNWTSTCRKEFKSYSCWVSKLASKKTDPKPNVVFFPSTRDLQILLGEDHQQRNRLLHRPWWQPNRPWPKRRTSFHLKRKEPLKNSNKKRHRQSQSILL